MISNSGLNYTLIYAVLMCMITVSATLFYWMIASSTNPEQRRQVYYFIGFFAYSSIGLFSYFIDSFSNIVAILVGNLFFLLAIFTLRRGIYLRNGLTGKRIRENKWVYISVFFIVIVLDVCVFYVMYDSAIMRTNVTVIFLSLLTMACIFDMPSKPFHKYGPSEKLLYLSLLFVPTISIMFLVGINFLNTTDIIFNLLLIVKIIQSYIVAMVLAVVLLIDAIAFHYERSITDSLTGVYNRLFFTKTVNDLASEGSLCNALLILDIDNFKVVNDTYGHISGDQVICHVAQTLQKNFPNDVVCRFGGEEFGIVCENQNITQVNTLAETICKQIEDTPIKCDGGFVNITISVGISVLSDDINSSLKRADRALYLSKSKGKNLIQVL